jgi:hypothetical protein
MMLSTLASQVKSLQKMMLCILASQVKYVQKMCILTLKPSVYTLGIKKLTNIKFSVFLI